MPATKDPQCSNSGCDAVPVEQCGYVDRHGARCSTHWCDLHVARFAGEAYCRRHADTLRALTTPFAEPPPLPAVDNRAASLLHWMAALLEEPVREILEARRDAAAESLMSDYVGAAAAPENPDAPSRDWTRRWRLTENDPVRDVVVVVLTVSEDNDDEVVIRLGHDQVYRGTPPWISGRRTKAPAKSHSADHRERREYLEGILADLEGAIDAVRPPRATRIT